MKANSSESVKEVMERVPQSSILNHYFGITSLPIVIKSPLRKDNNPSFGIYSPDGNHIKFRDFSTGESGDIYSLLGKYYNIPFSEVIRKIGRESFHFNKTAIHYNKNGVCESSFHFNSESDIKCRIREWRKYDEQYWLSYGISLSWLKYADVYPISHKIVYKDTKRYVFRAEKYAYVYVERKEGKVTLKIYQPFSKRYKWANKNDASVVGLWTKIPESGNRLIICSSLKDALCLWSNTGIPCIYVQSETTGLSDTALKVLKERYKHIYIMFDNDIPGLEDAEKLSSKTGFRNIVIPSFKGGKDISDMYKVINDKETFKIRVMQIIDEQITS